MCDGFENIYFWIGDFAKGKRANAVFRRSEILIELVLLINSPGST